MSLDECLSALSWHTVTFTAKEGRLLIHAPSLVLSDDQKATISHYKPLLLTILSDDLPRTPQELLNALEAYEERLAIMLESSVSFELAHSFSLNQVQRVLNPS